MSGDVDPDLVEEAYGFQDHIGFVMRGWERDYARFELRLEPCHMNRYGIPHGGVYALLLDTVMGFSGSYTGDRDKPRFAMTLSMTTNFLGRPADALLIAKGKRTGGGNSTFFAEGTVTDGTGTLVATATGTFRYRKGG